MGKTTDFDAIVVGAGHNGLICAAYLARAGLRTLLLEARATVGGCASSEDVLGVRVNICNCDHISIRATPVAEELDLHRHGLRYLDVDPGQLNLTWDGGPAWPAFHDVERTIDALGATHPREVDGYRRYVRDALPVARLIIGAAATPPSRTNLVRGALARRGAGATTLLRWSRMSAADVLRRYFASDDIVAPAVAAGPVIWGLSPEAPGTGLGALTIAMRHAARVGRPEGGSGMLPAALKLAFEAAGGHLRTGARVAGIDCDSVGVAGVTLDDATVITAPVVVSACDPRSTFLSWLRNPPSGAGRTIERWQTTPAQDGYESKIDAAIQVLPRYRRVDHDLAHRLGYDPLHPSLMVSPSVADLHRGAALMARGEVLDRPVLLTNVPSVLDPTMAPPGRHVLSLEVLFTPYTLRGGWAGSAEPRRWLDLYATDLVEPGFLDGLGEWRAMTPDRYEADLHLPRGHATSFAGGPLAALRGRPRELTRYETPISGLYLTGAATFPGAGIWGASGRSCAATVLRRR